MNKLKTLKNTLSKYPVISFCIALTILLGAIIAGSILRAPQAPPATTSILPKTVEIFTFDETPRMTFSAKVDKQAVDFHPSEKRPAAVVVRHQALSLYSYGRNSINRPCWLF